MTAITEARTFDAVVRRYDTLDPVLGGIAGESNDPIIALTNRSRFLYDYHNSFVGVAQVSGSATIDNTFLRKLIYVNITANATMSLSTGFIPGQTLHFKCTALPGKCAAIVPASGQNIIDGSILKSIWLYDGEEIDLVSIDSTTWEVRHAKGNHDIAGNDAMVRKQPRNSLIANGNSGLLRADYARLWAEVSGDAIDDFSWLSDPVTYRSRFSQGNGTTTFRLPDMRSMTWRGLDMGRGVSLSRIGTTPGSYEADGNKLHNHINGNFKKLLQVNGVFTTNAVDSSLSEPNILQSGDMLPEGNSEATVKSAGFIPIIYF